MISRIENRRNREGVALILVIGMLALMTVMGVTFSVYMRSERAAAGNFRTGVQNRELLQVALARALDAVDASVRNVVYPPWSALQSTGGATVNTTALGNNSITNAIPWAALTGVVPAPTWINASAAGGGDVGQYSWLVLNCSGLLDVNYAGGQGRVSGTNVAEVQLEALPEVGSPATADALVAGRPYDTMQELVFKSGGLLGGVDSNLVTYSNFPTNYTGGTDLGLVDISGSMADLISEKPLILAALGKSGFAASADQYLIFSNMLYYVDPAPAPLNTADLGGPLTKSVPMINEIQITNYVVVSSATKCSVFVRVDVEWYYPFLKPSPYPFSIKCDLNVSSVPAGSPFSPPSLSQTKAAYPGNIAGPAYGSQFFIAAIPNVSYSTGDTVRLSFQVGAQVLQGATLVDSVPYPYVVGSYFSTNGDLITIPTAKSGGIRGYECIDPRFNWNTAQAGAQWVSYNPVNPKGTINTTNWILTTPAYSSGYHVLHLAGQPFHQVGEMSYLLRTAAKWSPIRMFTNSNPDRVLDYFTVKTSTNCRGLVNVNSRSVDVLASAFKDLRLESYPGAGGTAISLAQAQSLAATLMTQNQTPITRMSDFGTNIAVMSKVDTFGSFTPFQRQAVLRESVGLFNYRQNYFIIILSARGGPLAKSGITALAEVWRDPVAGPSGNHPWFLRQYKVLDN